MNVLCASVCVLYMWQAPLHLLLQQVHATTISAIEKRSTVAQSHMHTYVQLTKRTAACRQTQRLLWVSATNGNGGNFVTPFPT